MVFLSPLDEFGPRAQDLQPGASAINARPRALERAVWAFVALGVLLRVVRYAMNYPLWWDETFVAVNFIRRGYIELLQPLDYGQVCPILFLWAELAIVKLLGFSEWSLRLFPLFCAVVSVVLFRHVAGRIVRGVPYLLGVAVFAVSFHPIRHAADLKPYASDLLAALVVLALVVEWLRAPQRTGWLWALAGVAPVALALSHPSIFVASGAIFGLAPAVRKARSGGITLAYGAFAGSTIAAFVAIYAVFTRAQAAATMATMHAQWTAAFPPLGDPLLLPGWLLCAHTGGMLAYPCGGEHGLSSASLLLFAAGAALLWIRGNPVVALTLLAPFAMGLGAAAIGRYPYGGVADGSPARVMQYLVPSICVLVGLGSAGVLALVRDPRRRSRVLSLVLSLLASVGIAPLAFEASHPYRSLHAQRSREFAHRFWPEFVHDAEPVCLLWDRGLGAWNSTNLNVAVYLCNQMIYSPTRRQHREFQWNAISMDHPLRCVLPLIDPGEGCVVRWLEEMRERYRLTNCRTIEVEMAAPGATRRTERFYVYEFGVRLKERVTGVRFGGLLGNQREQD